MSVRWSIFELFTRPVEHRSWSGVADWTSAIEAQLGTERDALARIRRSWDDALGDLGGDPSARDWTSFRPLRRDREEDWSDWLAQIIEDSRTGRFALALLGSIELRNDHSAYTEAVVHREVPHEGCRADLVIEWTDATYTHIEVKVGDPGLAKTLGTAQKMEMRFGRGRARRSDVVLLLPEQRGAWDAECREQPAMHDRVPVITWIDVARALRNVLPQSAEESMHWRVWAHAFCGAIEQDLLRMRSGREPRQWAHSLTFHGLDVATELLRSNGGC